MKVIVLFTDGLANTWYWPGFNCGPRNISPGPDLYDPITGARSEAGCSLPATIPSIDGVHNVLTFNDCELVDEAQPRAERIAYLARAAGNHIYVVGLADPYGFFECNIPPFPDMTFLKNVANTPDSPTYNPGQPSGDCVIATNTAALHQAFQSIASRILLHKPQ